jgi:long-subunit fatty acid transport protein
VNETIWNSTASAVAFDIGTTYETPFDGIILGVSITNFGQKMQINGKDLTTTVDIDPPNNGNNGQINTRLETDEFDLPLMLRVGLAWQPIKTEQVSATIMVDGTSPNDNYQSVSLGTEVTFLGDRLALRGGLPYITGKSEDERTLKFTAGAGIKHSLTNGLGFDFGYALNSYTNLGLVNRVSVAVTF